MWPREVETLTGFKWMGSKSADLRAEGFEVIFAYEEAIGFCCGDIVPLIAAGELVRSERHGGPVLLRGLTLGPMSSLIGY